MHTAVETYLTNASLALKVASEEKGVITRTEEAITRIARCFQDGGTLLIAGNGGSAADAEHFATEFTGRFMKERKARPAISLASSTSMLTAWSNDHNFEDVFARQIEAFGKAGDVFIGISTSGNSKNIIRAVSKAKTLGLTSITLLGNSGGELQGLADITIAVQDTRTSHIQEVQIALIHCICQEVEKTFTE
ncbi:MAG: SIS domain-containing protein [Candidatus Taylorbacteria bacterium]|nr:SIS domain-containing protein [Candidatus Taylorbacteria bacterium]